MTTPTIHFQPDDFGSLGHLPTEFIPRVLREQWIQTHWNTAKRQSADILASDILTDSAKDRKLRERHPFMFHCLLTDEYDIHGVFQYGKLKLHDPDVPVLHLTSVSKRDGLDLSKKITVAVLKEHAVTVYHRDVSTLYVRFQSGQWHPVGVQLDGYMDLDTVVGDDVPLDRAYVYDQLLKWLHRPLTSADSHIFSHRVNSRGKLLRQPLSQAELRFYASVRREREELTPFLAMRFIGILNTILNTIDPTSAIEPPGGNPETPSKESNA